MKKILSFILVSSLSSPLLAKEVEKKEEKIELKKEEKKDEKKVEHIIHEHRSTETININTNRPPRRVQLDEFFCAKTAKESEKDCKDWLKDQKKTLGKSVKTSYCTRAKTLYYDQPEHGCSTFLTIGKISYLEK